MTTIYFPYTESHEGGDICEGYDEDDPFPCHETMYTYRTYRGAAYLKPSTMWFDQVDSEHKFSLGDTVYLVDVTYSSGSTFGQEEGYHSLVSIHREEWEADLVAAQIRGGDYDGYKPWVGYFEGLISVDVRSFVIEDN